MTEATPHQKRFPLICPHCEKPTLASVTSSAQGGGDFTTGEPPYLLQLVDCGTCREPFLVVEEDFGDGWDGEPGILWPQQQRTLSLKVPEALRREHEEARHCFSAKAYTATAVMVRRTLECVCLDQGVANTTGRPKPLFKMLEQMKAEGKIDERLFEWSQALRVLGNDGAHFTGNQVSREDAADGLALAEALLDYLYVLSAQFAAFKERRAKTEAAKGSSPAADES